LAWNSRRVLLGGAALVVAAAGAYLLVDRPVDESSSSTGVAASSGAPSGTPASGTTAEAAGPSSSGAVPDPRASDAPPPPSIPPADEVATDEPVPASDGPADVVVSYAGWDDASSSVEVSAFLGGVLEDGGTCTLTLTKDGASQTASTAGTADVSTTICGLLSVPDAGLTPGTWSAVVTYDSSATTGSSDPVQVTVP
jgi:hypothetical protein